MTKNPIRGIAGFQVDGELKLAYQANGAAPKELGVNLLREIREVEDWGAHDSQLYQLIAIEENRPIDQLSHVRAEIRRRFDSSFQVTNARDLYDLMEPFQGSIKWYLDGDLSVLAQADDFLADSKHCEWGYVVNVDSDRFEIYRGHQTEPHDAVPPNICDSVNSMGYYPCKLIQNYRLEKLPSNLGFLEDLKRFE